MSVLIVGFSLGLSLAFLDVLLSVVQKPTELAAFSNLFAPLGASMLAVLLLFAAAAVVSPFIQKWLARDHEVAVLAGLAVFLATSFVVAAFARLFTFERSLPGVVWLTAVFAVSLAVDVIAYVAVLSLRPAPETKRRPLYLTLVIPALLFEALLFVWIQSYGVSGVPSLGTPLLSLGFVCVALATFFICRRVTRPAAILGSLATGVLLVLVSSIATVARLVGAHHADPMAARGDNSPKHIILITIDTLRPDFLSCYRADAIQTPHIDALAADGFVFKNAYSPAPWTLPSMASLMTGVSPFVHLAQKIGSRVPSTLPTLADLLRRAGYHTAAIGRSPALLPHTNVRNGFLDYEMFPKSGYGSSLGAAVLKVALGRGKRWDASTDELSDAAVRWLRSNAERDFFLWLHYFDPHEPYAPPAPFLPSGTPEPRIGVSCSLIDDVRSGFFVPTGTEMNWIAALYKGEVRYVDSNVGRVLDALRQLGLYDEALIVLTSDHGEEFWEHGGFEHGHSVYNEVIHVPLIMKLPQETNRGESDVVVPTGAIMPTVLDLCRIPFDWDGYDVRTLLPIVSGHPEAYENRGVMSTSTLYYEDRVAIFFEGLKYILSVVSGREELYDLATDPAERVSIAKQRPDAIKQARDLLEERKQRSARLKERFHIVSGELIAPDIETIEELRSLGYVR